MMKVNVSQTCEPSWEYHGKMAERSCSRAMLDRDSFQDRTRMESGRGLLDPVEDGIAYPWIKYGRDPFLCRRWHEGQRNLYLGSIFSRLGKAMHGLWPSFKMHSPASHWWQKISCPWSAHPLHTCKAIKQMVKRRRQWRWLTPWPDPGISMDGAYTSPLPNFSSAVNT